MDSEGLIRVAKDLVGNDDQCFQKSSVNRAYYAAYHSIKPAAEKHLGFVGDRYSSTHKQLSRCLMDSGNEEIKDLGVKLRGLHKQRTDCDYKLDTKLVKTEASLAIMMSESLIGSFLKACKSFND